MKNLWDENEATKQIADLDLRVYTSRLLGQENSLVLHGGGNTSVKCEDILYVKGSGWDLATIEAEGFAPVKMDTLLKMAKLKELSDEDMVKQQRLAMTNPSAPNPSVEAILHAIIPFKFVDHTHADAVVTITNTENGYERIKELYGDKILVIPYIMPGFVLAKLVYEMTRGIDWDFLDGMVLMNHGLFTFNDDAKKSYEKTIELVSKAEKYLQDNGATLESFSSASSNIELIKLAKIRKEVSSLKGHATISTLNESNIALSFSNSDLQKTATQGPLTPDHVIRTKRLPVIIDDDFKTSLSEYIKEYKKYFFANKTNQTMLNPAPNFAILKEFGSLSFGKNAKEANIIKDINEHSFEAILKAEKLGGYKALDASKIFEVEYWSLEQAKLKKSTQTKELSGKIVIVTDAINGVSLEIAKVLHANGCVVVVLDKNPDVESIFNKVDMVGIVCDLSLDSDIQNAIDFTVKNFGGIDMVIDLQNSQKLMQYTKMFLELGII